MSTASINTEAKILSRALDSSPLLLTDALAQFLQSLAMDPRDAQRADELAEKARHGTLVTVRRSPDFMVNSFFCVWKPDALSLTESGESGTIELSRKSPSSLFQPIWASIIVSSLGFSSIAL